jgi:hypothetical protein
MTKREHLRRHHPKEGETRSPMTEGTQRGAHAPEERDPHEPLATPERETPDVVGRRREPDGMGSRPPARGERRASRPMPPPGE